MTDKKILLVEIKQAVAAEFGVTEEALKGRSRKHEVANPRVMAFEIGRLFTDLTWGQIGQGIGWRHHATAISSFRHSERLAEKDKASAEHRNRVLEKLGFIESPAQSLARWKEKSPDGKKPGSLRPSPRIRGAFGNAIQQDNVSIH